MKENGLRNMTTVNLEDNASMLAKFDANQLSITTHGNKSQGITVLAGSVVSLGDGSSIKTTGENSAGIIVSGGIFNADALYVSTQGSVDSPAIKATDQGIATIGASSHLKAEKNAALAAIGSGSVINFQGTPRERMTLASGSHAGGGVESIGAKINLEYVDAHVESHGFGESIILATDEGVVNLSHSNLSATGDDAIGIFAKDGGKAYLSGDTKIQMDDSDQFAILATGANARVSGTGKMNIKGGIFAEAKAIVTLSMSQGSKLTGSVDNAAATATVRLSLSGSQWNMTEDSEVSKLALSDSTVEFVENKANKTGSILKVGDLSGDSTFVMQVNAANKTSDKLVVTGVSSGHHNIILNTSDKLLVDENDALTVVETQDGNATFNLSKITNQPDSSAPLYDVRQSANGKDWELYAARPKNNDLTDIKTTSSNTNQIERTDNTSSIDDLLSYTETQALLQRMSASHKHQDDYLALWTRAFRTQFDDFNNGFDRVKKSDREIQAALNEYLTFDDADLQIGIKNTKNTAGSNDTQKDECVKDYHVGTYSSCISKNDFYITTLFKYHHLKNSFNIIDTYGELINGSAKNKYQKLIQRFYFGDGKPSYYLEPQTELSYTQKYRKHPQPQINLNHRLDQDDSVLEGFHGLIDGEIIKISDSVKDLLQVYEVAEKNNAEDSRSSHSGEQYDVSDNWRKNFVPITAEINQHNQISAENTYSTGDRFTQMPINAGFRYSF